jgi:(S)-ureidoglycine-glyoxylate aminotransferase
MTEAMGLFRKQNVLLCLGALEATLRSFGFQAPAGSGVDAALSVYRAAEQPAQSPSA